MRILLLGGGGREHALAWKLAPEAEILAAPGNPGIAQFADCRDTQAIPELARAYLPDLVVIGPEAPLIAGLADQLRDDHFAVLGPGAEGAQLEGSKAWSKALMAEAGIPTAAYRSFRDPEAAHRFVSELGACVVKASGAALGKGVVVAASEAEAHEAVDAMLVGGAFGDAGAEIVVEERLVGPEFSVLTLCSGEEIYSLPAAQDYKRALDRDRGPNTGGMGSFSPVPHIPPARVAEVEMRVVRPALAALKTRGIDFRGVLFSGLMVHEGEIRCLEFNVRFGDPETQTIVRRVGSGFAAALLACAKGEPIPPVQTLANAAVTVVVASAGYPGEYEKGIPISIDPLPEGVLAFHAGTRMEGDALVTAGGRVLAISAAADDIEQARRLAYLGVQGVHFAGARTRSDIAATEP